MARHSAVRPGARPAGRSGGRRGGRPRGRDRGRAHDAAFERLRLLRRRLLTLARRRLPRLRTLAIGGFMLAMVAAFATALALQAGRSDQPAPPAQGDWAHVASAAPLDVRSAAQATAMYQETLRGPTALGQALRAGKLGTPALVRAYRATPGMSDVWVIPVYAPPSAATPTALLDFAVDATGQNIQAVSFAGPFAPGDPEYKQPFPRVRSDEAAGRLQQARGRGMAAGRQPELIYFPADLERISGPHATLTWTGGGQFPDLAIWRLPASDGQDYLVGADYAVYTPAQLPLAPGA